MVLFRKSDRWENGKFNICLLLIGFLFSALPVLAQTASKTSPHSGDKLKPSSQDQNRRVSPVSARPNALSEPLFEASETSKDSSISSNGPETGSNPPKACGSGPKIAADIWQEYEKKTKEAGCYVDWAPSSAERFGACMREYSKLPLQLGEELIAFWNAMANNKWATIGPRRVEPGTNKGTLVSPGNRLWLTSTPEFMDRTSIEIKKRNAARFNFGLGMLPLNTKVDITVCSTGPKGNTRIVEQETVLAKEGAGTVLDESLSNPRPGILSVNLQSQAAVPLTFKYSLKVETEPKKFNVGPVDGFADIHVHQIANEGFGGLWYWGDHAGPLKADEKLGTDITTPIEVLINNLTNESVDVEKEATGAINIILGNERDTVKIQEEAFDFYKHAIPNVFPPKAHMTIEHGEPKPSTLGSWPRFDDIAHQQANARWLKEAHDNGLKLIVASMVNFQAVCKAMRVALPEQSTDQECGDWENITEQLKAAQEMDKKYDWYEIAVHPWHARKIIHEGKLAVVLSAEASNLFAQGLWEGSYIAGVEKLRTMGLRTMQLAHETNSIFAGAAPHKKLFGAFEFLKHPFKGEAGFDLNDQGKNEKGLTGHGHQVVELLMDRHMPIDIAHLSEKATRQLYGVAAGNNYYPLYNSHTRMKGILTDKKKKKQREFLTTCEQARFIEQTGGMVGLRTGDTDLRTHRTEVSKDVDGDGEKESVFETVVDNSCPGSVRSFAQLVQFTNDQTGLKMAFGSDLNGFITQIGPRYGPSACHRSSSPFRADYRANQNNRGLASDDYYHMGLSHIGYLPDVLKDLDQVGANTGPLENSAEAFLKMWERAWSENRSGIQPTTECPGWSNAHDAERAKAQAAEADWQIDGNLSLQVKGLRGTAEIDGYSSGKAIAGSFQRQVTFGSVKESGDMELLDLHIHKAGWDSMGFMRGEEFVREYEPDTKFGQNGRYSLETTLLDNNDHARTGHTFFRTVPNPDSIRAEVDFTLNGSQNVVSYHWNHNRSQYAFTHSRGTQGVSNTGGWHFKDYIVPEARTKDRYTVQDFYMEIDGNPVEPGDTLRTPGEHTLAIYACHNVLAKSCDSIEWEEQQQDREKEKKKRRHQKDKDKDKKKGERQNENVAPGPLPPGMMLISRQTFTLASTQSSEQASKEAESEKKEMAAGESQGGVGLTLKPKGGFSLPGVSNFGDISGLAGGNIQNQNSVFTWGASATFGSRDGFANFRLTGLHRSATTVTTLQNDQITTTQVDMSFTALSADLVLNPLPRIVVQPYLLAGYGYRKLSFSGSSQNIDESWKQTVPVGAGADIPLGNEGVVIGIELVDYISNFSGSGKMRHDAFMLGTVGIPLY